MRYRWMYGVFMFSTSTETLIESVERYWSWRVKLTFCTFMLHSTDARWFASWVPEWAAIASSMIPHNSLLRAMTASSLLAPARV